MDCATLSAQPGAAPTSHIQLREWKDAGPCVVLGRPPVYVDLHSYRPPPLQPGLRLERAGLEGWRARDGGSGLMLYTLVREREGVDPRVLVHAVSYPGGKVDRVHAVAMAWGEGAVRVRGRVAVDKSQRAGWDEALAIVAYGGAIALGETVYQHDARGGWTRHESPRAWREAVVFPWLLSASLVELKDQLRLARERGHRALADLLESALRGERRAS